MQNLSGKIKYGAQNEPIIEVNQWIGCKMKLKKLNKIKNIQNVISFKITSNIGQLVNETLK